MPSHPSTGPRVYMNLGIPDAIHRYRQLPFDGIGLLRVEFLLASSVKTHPLQMIREGNRASYIEVLSAGIATVAEAVAPRPVVVRFSDFKSNEYRGLVGGSSLEPPEENPMMGLRGISRYISPEFAPVFRAECEAIRMVRERWANVWVMLPFARTPEETSRCLSIMSEEELVRGREFKIWVMAEVPSVALLMDQFNLLPIDGYSIGSNDLTQLVLGVDRDSAVLDGMGYFDESNLAVLRAMELIVLGAAAAGKTFSICGESASDQPEVVRRLVELGIDSLSVNPDAVEATRSLVDRLDPTGSNNELA